MTSERYPTYRFDLEKINVLRIGRGEVTAVEFDTGCTFIDEPVELRATLEGVPDGTPIQFQVFKRTGEDEELPVGEPLEGKAIDGEACALWSCPEWSQPVEAPEGTELDPFFVPDDVPLNDPWQASVGGLGEEGVSYWVRAELKGEGCESEEPLTWTLDTLLKDDLGELLPDTEVTLICADGSERGATSDGEARLQVSGLPFGPVSVHADDPDDPTPWHDDEPFLGDDAADERDLAAFLDEDLGD